MKELRKWSEEGATVEEIRLLASARSLRPSASSRARMAAALGGGASVLAAGSATGATVASSATTVGIGLYAKLASVVLAVGIASGVAWHFVGRSPAAHRSPRAEGTAQSPTQAPKVKTAPVVASTVLGDPPITGAPSGSPLVNERGAPASASARSSLGRPRPSQPPAASAGLSEEVAALERARKALATESPEAALRELRAYHQRFPHGELASEETVLRVQALLASGDNQKAAALAAGFARAHPESPLASRVLELVHGPREKP